MSKASEFFLDSSVLMEILLDREKKDWVLSVLEESGNLFISMLTVHQIFHFGTKEKISQGDLEFFIEQFTVLDLSYFTYQKAKTILRGKDMEDALQIATALNNNLKKVFSLDQEMIKKYQDLVKFVA